MSDDILRISSVRIHPGSVSQHEAMKEAADLLVAAGSVTEGYYTAMLQREASVSTFMGNGLAIPHGTNDAKDEILTSGLTLVRYDGGIDWDGETVHFVMGIAGKGDSHLEILGRVAILFSDEDDVAELQAAPTAEALFTLVSSVNEE